MDLSSWIEKDSSALLLVDIQVDFLPGGPLAVPEGDRILDPVNHLIEQDIFGLYLATQDWHPADHVSFASNHRGKEPMQTIGLNGRRQILWPDRQPFKPRELTVAE